MKKISILILVAAFLSSKGMELGTGKDESNEGESTEEVKNIRKILDDRSALAVARMQNQPKKVINTNLPTISASDLPTPIPAGAPAFAAFPRLIRTVPTLKPKIRKSPRHKKG